MDSLQRATGLKGLGMEYSNYIFGEIYKSELSMFYSHNYDISVHNYNGFLGAVI